MNFPADTNVAGRILDALFDGPSTSAELAAILGIRSHTVSQRLTLLQRKGLVESVGEMRSGGRPSRIVQLARTKRRA